MKHHVLSLISLLFAAGALAVALVRTTSAAHRPAAASTTSTDDDRAFEARMARVEDELALLRGAVEASRLSAPIEREVVAPDATAESAAVDARLVELERRVLELREVRPAATAPSTPRFSDSRSQDAAKAIDAWTQQARDVALTEAERMAALRRLRGSSLPDGTDARLGVLPEMIRLAEQSQDPRVRADVWRQLSHVTDRTILAPLLHALRNDPAADVREEAAETLADFLPDPNVRSALQFAGEHDESPKVRAQAYESLASVPR